MKVTIDPSVHPQFTPYVASVTNPRTGKAGYKSDWTNEDLCKVYGVTETEWQKMLKEVQHNNR